MHSKKPTWVLGESPLREVDHRTLRERSELTQALRHAHSAAEAAERELAAARERSRIAEQVPTPALKKRMESGQCCVWSEKAQKTRPPRQRLQRLRLAEVDRTHATRPCSRMPAVYVVYYWCITSTCNQCDKRG